MHVNISSISGLSDHFLVHVGRGKVIKLSHGGQSINCILTNLRSELLSLLLTIKVKYFIMHDFNCMTT